MSRLHRWVFALMLAFAAMFGVAPASAQELRELPGPAVGAGPAPSAERRDDRPALTMPTDMPVVSSREMATIPPVPASYITANLGWLKISYPAVAKERVEPVLKNVEAMKADLTYALGVPVLEHLEVRIVPTVADMARLAPPSMPPPSYASGVAYSGMHFVLVSMMAPRGGDAVDVEEVLHHELAHVALEDAVKGHHVPVWFNEGLAISLSGERPLERERVLGSATLSGTLLPFADLDRSFPRDQFEVNIAYAESASFVRFLLKKSDHLRFVSMIERVREGTPFERALGDAYGADLRKLEFQWRGEMDRRYSVIPLLTGGGLIWVLVIGGLGYAYVRKRRRAKAILDKWEQEEALEDALRARRAAEAEALAAAEGEDVLLRVSVKAPKVEHDGNWHTLH